MQTLLYGAPKPAEPFIREPGLVEMTHRTLKVIRVASGTAFTLGYESHLIFEGKPSGILLVRAIDDEAERVDADAAADEFNGLHDIAVNERHLFARLKIAPRLFRPLGRNAKSDTPA